MDGTVARRSEVNIRVVESRKELFRELNLSFSITAHSFFVNGDAGATYLDETNFQEDSLVWLVIGTVDFGRVRLKNAKLKDFAADLLKNNNHEEFQRQCGMHYVSQERRGASVFALYTLKNLSNKEKRDFKAWLNFNTSNIPFVSVESKNKFSKALAEFARNKQLSFRIFAIGGKGISALSEVPKSEGDITKIREIVGSYLGGFTLDNAVPLEFLSSSFEQFGWKPSSTDNWNRRDVVLSEYYFLASSIDADRKRLNDILHTQRDAYRHLSAKENENLQRLLKERTDLWNRLHNEAQACIAATEKCAFPQLETETIIWPRTMEALARSSRVWLLHLPAMTTVIMPEMSQVECDLQRKYALRSGCIDEDELAELESINAAPLCLAAENKIASLCYCHP